MRARLVNPVTVTIQRIDKAATGWDETFREPTGAVAYGPAETIRAQVAFQDYERQVMGYAGDSPASAGYMLYDRATPRLVKGDKVTAIGEVQLSTPLYAISDAEPTAPYRGRFYLDMVRLATREKRI